MPRLITRRSHGFYAVLFWTLAALMFAAAGLRAQEESPLPLSLPANPWTAEPAKIGATLLFFPWEEEGRHYSGVRSFATELQLHFQGADLPQLGIIRGSAAWTHLESMRQYDEKAGIPVNPEHHATLARFFGATHVLNSKLQVDEDLQLWHLDATLTGPGPEEVFQRRFTVPRRHLYVLTTEVAAWIGECLGDLLTPESVERLGKPLRGAEYTHDEIPEAAALFPEDPASPEWDALIARHPEQHYLPLMRASRFSISEHRDLMRRLAAEPLPVDAHPFQRMARSTLLSETDPRAALHEWEILAARYPGVDQYSYRLLQYPLSSEFAPDDAIRRVERWHRRAPASPYNDWRLASELHRVARELRGGGYANTIPEENLRRIHVYSVRSVELTSKALGEVGPLPIPMRDMFDPLALAGQGASIHQCFRASSKVYPYHYPLYSGYLNYLLPRWGGNHLFLLTFINETLDRDPNWVDPAFLVAWAVMMEAQVGMDKSANERPMQIMTQFIKEREIWSNVVRKSMEHALGPNATSASATMASLYAILLQDTEALMRIAASHPDVVVPSSADLPIYCGLDHDYLPPMARATFEAGLPEACLRVVDVMSAARSSTLNPEYPKVFEQWGMYKATSLAYLGRAEESEAIWALMPADSPMHVHRWISWAVANHRVEEVLEEAGAAYEEKPESIHHAGAYALALARSGQKEKAREVLAGVALFDQSPRWTYLKNAAREIVLEEKVGEEPSSAGP